MKKCLIFILFLTILSASYSQEFRVKSMLELTHDLSARTSPRIDKRGVECALIRVNIPTIKDVYFQSPIIGDPIQAPGEYTVYVPTSSERLHLICDGKPVDIVFSEFDITLQPKSSYRVVITKESGSTESAGFARVNISVNFDDDILLVDGFPAGQLPLVLDDLALGNHVFAIPNTNGRVQHDTTINITSNITSITFYLHEEPLKLAKIHTYTEGNFIGRNSAISEVVPVWGMTIQKQAGKQGLVDYCGNVLIPFRYEEISIDDFRDDNSYAEISDGGRNGYIRVMKNKKWGFYRIGEGEILPCNYSLIIPIWNYWIETDSVTNTYQGEKSTVGIFDLKTRRFVLPSKYNGLFVDINLWGDKYIMIRDSKQRQLKILDHRGNVKLTFPDRLSVLIDKDNGLLATYCDETGYRFGNNHIYDLNSGTKIYTLPNNLAFAGEDWHDGLILVKNDAGRYGYINRHGKVVIPVVYKEVSWGPSTTIPLSLLTQNDYWEYFSTKGDLIATYKPGTKQSYSTISEIETGVYSGKNHLLCKNAKNEKGVIDWDGNIIVPFSKGEVEPGSGYYNVINAAGNQTIINFDGKVIWTGKSKEICSYDYVSKTLVLSNNSLQIINNYDGIVANIPVSSDAVFRYWCEDGHGRTVSYHCDVVFGNNIIQLTKEDRLIRVVNSKTGKYGFMSSQGELLTSCIYDEYASIGSFISENEYEGFKEECKRSMNEYTASEGYGIIRLGDHFGFINTEGKVVVPMIYSAVTPFHNGVSYVRDMSGKWTKLYSKDLK